MKKGIFIPDITVEMFRNASLEAVEELLVSGTMEDIEIPDRPHGEWIYKRQIGDCSSISYNECSNCKCKVNILDVFFMNFCPNCGADMREGDSDA